MQDYLIKQSHEFLWHFTYMQNNGLCFSRLSNGHKQEYEVLLQEARPDYTAVIDDNNQIHIVCQDDTGSIIYLNNFDRKWHKYVILQSKAPTSYDKNFQLVLINQWLNLFYTIEYRGKKMLTHHILDSSVEPIVLDYIGEEYTTVADPYHNIWVFYYSEISNAFGYRKYAWNKKEWEAFEPFKTAEGLAHFQCLIGTDDKIHLIGEQEGEIIYATAEEKRILGKGKNPILYSDKNILWSMWLAQYNIQAMKSTDDGLNWRSSGDFISGRATNPTLFLLAYTSFEKGLHAKKCYGYFNNDLIRLYVLNNYLDIPMLPPAIKEQAEGEQVTEFARQSMKLPEETPSETADEGKSDIELTKIKIQLIGLGDQMSKIEKKIDFFKEQFHKIELLLEPKQALASGEQGIEKLESVLESINELQNKLNQLITKEEDNQIEQTDKE